MSFSIKWTKNIDELNKYFNPKVVKYFDKDTIPRLLDDNNLEYSYGIAIDEKDRALGGIIVKLQGKKDTKGFDVEADVPYICELCACSQQGIKDETEVYIAQPCSYAQKGVGTALVKDFAEKVDYHFWFTCADDFIAEPFWLKMKDKFDVAVTMKNVGKTPWGTNAYEFQKELNEFCTAGSFAAAAPANGFKFITPQPYYKKLNKSQVKNFKRKKLKRLTENPILEKPQLADVYSFAKQKHDETGAVRKHSKLPYFTHSELVADIALVYGGTDKEIAIALLHDVLEDTDTSIREIEIRYGADVAECVSEITNDPYLVNLYGKENYINKELSEIDHSALFVKLCDMYANLLDYPTESQRKRILNNVNYFIENKYEDLDDRERVLLKSFPGIDFNLDRSEVDCLNEETPERYTKHFKKNIEAEVVDKTLPRELEDLPVVALRSLTNDYISKLKCELLSV